MIDRGYQDFLPDSQIDRGYQDSLPDSRNDQYFLTRKICGCVAQLEESISFITRRSAVQFRSQLPKVFLWDSQVARHSPVKRAMRGFDSHSHSQILPGCSSACARARVSGTRGQRFKSSHPDQSENVTNADGTTCNFDC